MNENRRLLPAFLTDFRQRDSSIKVKSAPSTGTIRGEFSFRIDFDEPEDLDEFSKPIDEFTLDVKMRIKAVVDETDDVLYDLKFEAQADFSVIEEHYSLSDLNEQRGLYFSVLQPLMKTVADQHLSLAGHPDSGPPWEMDPREWLEEDGDEATGDDQDDD